MGEAYGTKKARKAIRDKVENAISPRKAGDRSSSQKLGAGDVAMMASLNETTATMATREELQAVLDQAKPVPQANLDASDI